MKGRVCVVTGANSGLGKQTALDLAKKGAHVVMICRSKERGEAAQAEIKAAAKNESVDLHLCDLSSQKQIRDLADKLAEEYEEIHVLVNNAGMWASGREETEEGIEKTLAINHL